MTMREFEAVKLACISQIMNIKKENDLIALNEYLLNANHWDTKESEQLQVDLVHVARMNLGEAERDLLYKMATRLDKRGNKS